MDSDERTTTKYGFYKKIRTKVLIDRKIYPNLLVDDSTGMIDIVNKDRAQRYSDRSHKKVLRGFLGIQK
jgi:hypothetical protein